MANVTYHDHAAGTGTPDTIHEIPVWDTNAAGVKKYTAPALRQYRINLTPVTAAGTSSQANATALSNSYDYHLIGTVAPNAGTKFAAITSNEVGRPMIIRCSKNAANNLTHYPPSGGSINEQSADVGVIIEADRTIAFISVSTVDWITISP
jgi:hypothetical protein